MTDLEVIEWIVQRVLDKDGYQKMNWPDLKERMAQCRLLDMDRLEEMRPQIVSTYKECIKKKRQREDQELEQDLLACTREGRQASPLTKTNPAALPTPPRSRTPSNSEGSDKLPLPKSEDNFTPTLDEAANAKGPCVLTIYLANKNKWEGAALKYCLEDWSYMSSRWAKRHALDVVDGRISLTWTPNDRQETYNTLFVLIEGLDCDFMLGSKSRDEDFNKPSNDHTPNSKPDGYNELLRRPHSQSYHDSGKPDIDLISDLIVGVGKALQRQEYGASPQGHVVDDGRSVSSGKGDVKWIPRRSFS